MPIALLMLVFGPVLKKKAMLHRLLCKSQLWRAQTEGAKPTQSKKQQKIITKSQVVCTLHR